MVSPSDAKPVGPYETFGECVGAMQRRGYPEASARRICGAMEAQGAKRFSEAATLLSALDALEVAVSGPAGTKRRASGVTRADLRLARRLDRDAKVIAAVGAANLTPAWRRLGNMVAEAFLALAAPQKGRKDGLDFFAVAGMDDGALQAHVHSVENLIDWTGYGKAWLGRPYERIYQMAGSMTFAAVSERIGIDIGFNLEEPAAQRVLATGGTRRGLIDIQGDTRSAILGTMEEARKEGWGPPDAARRLRELVPAGRFWRMQQADPPHGNWPGGGVAYRSNLIARTETKYAQNIAAYEAGAAAGFDTYIVFDARIGPTDAECEAINGQIVDGATARRLLDEEHPNGTRSISPVPRDAANPPIVDVPVSRAQQAAFDHRPPLPPDLPSPSTVQQVIEKLPLEQQHAAAKRYRDVDADVLLIESRRLDWRANLSSLERAGLNQFKGEGYDDINEYQVRKAKGTLDQWLSPGNEVADAKRRRLMLNVEGLNKAIEKAPPLEFDTMVYRGMVLDKAKYRAFLATGELRQVSTFSTTLEQSIAADFAEPWGDKVGIRLNVMVPRGTRAASFATGTVDREKELAFLGPARLQVIKVHPEEAAQHAGRTLTPIDVVLVPDAPLAKVVPERFERDAPLPEHVTKPLAAFEDAHRADKVETAFGINAKGEVVIDKSQGHVRRVQFTNEEAASLRGAVLTHNHPGGTAFSVDDLAFLRSHELHEIRVARNGDGTIAARLTDKGLGLAPATFRSEVQAANREVEREMRSRIDAGTISPERANRTHADRLSSLLQERGLVTIRYNQ